MRGISTPLAWLGALTIAASQGACGSRGGAKLASAAAEAVVKSAVDSGKKRPPRYLGQGGHCSVWDRYRHVCPPLPNCQRLNTDDGLQVNACAANGRLEPINVCRGYQGVDRWCHSGEFPTCDRVVGTACVFDQYVCEAAGERRLLECCTTEADCEAGTFVLADAPRPPREAP